MYIPASSNSGRDMSDEARAECCTHACIACSSEAPLSSESAIEDVETANFESRFFEVLYGNKISRKSKFCRLLDAATFLFSEGTNVLPAHVSTGEQGRQGPLLKHIMALRAILETMTLSDLELDRKVVLQNYQTCLAKQKSSGSQKVASFWDIVNTPIVSIIVFLLPSGCSLEAHGHPGMVVLSKVLLGSLKAQVLSALGPADPNETSDDVILLKSDPGPVMLPLNEPILDFGATPLATNEWTSQYEVLKMSTRMSEQLPLRRRMIVGSRTYHGIGEQFDCVELFSGVVSQSTLDKSLGAIPDDVCPASTLKASFESNAESLSPRTDFSNEGTSLPSFQSQGREWACIVADHECPSTLLCTPCFGNLHRFEADSDFVLVFDLISPSYEVPKSRECQYVMTQPTGLRTSEDTLEKSSLPMKPTPLSKFPIFSAVVVDEDSVGPDVFLKFRSKIPLV